MTIRWPWVSRERLESAERDCALWRRSSDLNADVSGKALRALNQAEARYDNLLEKYHEIARPAAPVVTGPVAFERPHVEPSAITRVIREQCETADGRTDHALARHLRSYAKDLKAKGATEDQIVAALVAWQTSEPASIEDVA